MKRYINLLLVVFLFFCSASAYAETSQVGDGITSSVKEEVDNTLNKINEAIPVETKTSFLNIFYKIELFRTEKLQEINIIKNTTDSDILSIKKIKEKGSVGDPLKEPISYIKLVLFIILSFVFASQIVFYIVFVLIIFYILRFIYRKIRNR